MEIYNVHATLKRKSKDKLFLVEVVKKLKEDPEHSFQLLQELDPEILKRFDEQANRRGGAFSVIAGNDAHQNVKPFGLQLDPYARAFRFVSTHVLATELTQEAVLQALKTRHAYVAFDILHPIRLGGGERPSEVPGLTGTTTLLGSPKAIEGVGRFEAHGEQRQVWYLPVGEGRLPWVFFPYSQGIDVPGWP
jgi:hypothetical protein